MSSVLRSVRKRKKGRTLGAVDVMTERGTPSWRSMPRWS